MTPLAGVLTRMLGRFLELVNGAMPEEGGTREEGVPGLSTY